MTDMSEISKAPPPELFTLTTDQWTKPFWEAAAAHRLVAPKCGCCSTFRMPPTPFCPNCLSQELEWPELSGQGVLYSYTIVARAIIPEMAAHLPYVPALVELPDAGGVRLITNIVGAPLDALEIGCPVQVVWDDRPDGVSIPCFRLVRTD